MLRHRGPKRANGPGTRVLTGSLLVVLLLPGLLGGGCTARKSVQELSPGSQPLFIDDVPKKELLQALDRQLHYLQSLPPEQNLTIGNRPVPPAEAIASLQAFREIIEGNPTPFELNRLVSQRFTVYQAEGREDGTAGEILLTGYYEPLFDGSLSPTPPYRYPLYAIPADLISRKDERTGDSEVGRLDDSGALVPYWTRAEIETRDLARGRELVYLRDPLDAYLLHVQGSGRIRLPDGEIRAIRFAASSGREYNSLGKLFVDERLMALEEVSIPRIRDYFRDHPEDIERMLHHNPRYTFFSWGDNQGPRGSLGEILTPGRSIAVDRTVLPVGAVGYLVSRRPVLDRSGQICYWQPLRRFVVPQDSGAAIKGAGRADMFWGYGRYAESAASHMRETGKLYFLLQNHFEAADKIR